MLCVAGVLWACGWSEEEAYTVFSPEYFVGKEYSFFFYDGNHEFYQGYNNNGDYYYDDADTTGMHSDNYLNNPITAEWDKYLKHAVPRQNIHYLLFKAKLYGVDSVYKYFNGSIAKPPPFYPVAEKSDLHNKRVKSFFDYLRLAKACEQFAVRPIKEYWDDKPDTITIAPGLDTALAIAFNKTKDPFIKERLWFQQVRLAYFDDKGNYQPDTLTNSELEKSEIVQLYNKYEKKATKNLVYYRTMGYLAGYYYRHKAYANANYLYSLCFANSDDLKKASDWSFHPQNETDWLETLQLAKNKEEKITLWQMLGMNNDAGRGIKEIARLDIRSDKMDLLLSRLINAAEAGKSSPVVNTAELKYPIAFPFTKDTANVNYVNAHNDSSYNAAYATAYNIAIRESVINDADMRLVDSLSNCKLIAKPYYWHLAAGYLHYLHYDYEGCAKFYALAEKEFPAGDKMIMAQYKLLSVMLYTQQISHIDAKVEDKLIEPLNWLANLRDGKENVQYLRFNDALNTTIDAISKAYLKQGDKKKAILFGYGEDYNDFNKIEAIIKFITKPDKSAFERAMIRYYPHKLTELYYQQALIMTYKGDLDRAVTLMGKTDTVTKNSLLYANPFNSRLNDCHDCEAAAPQKHKYSMLDLLQTMKAMKDELKAGKNVYRNAYLMANAYYNISYYGNSRVFYEGSLSRVPAIGEPGDGLQYLNLFTEQTMPEKYYEQALKNAGNDEQRALCTFMLSKCDRNTYYNVDTPTQGDGTQYGLSNEHVISSWPNFKVLHDKYSRTKYYAEVLKECGDFKEYVDSVNNVTVKKR